MCSVIALPQFQHPCYTSLLHCNCISDTVIHDHNDKTKSKGFLANESSDLTFTEPERQVFPKNDIGIYVNMVIGIKDIKFLLSIKTFLLT